MTDFLSVALALIATGGVLVGAGLLIIWLARRGAEGTLKRNPIAGVRTSLTLSSDEAWYSAQRAAAPRTRIAGLGAVIGGAATAGLGLLGLSLDTTMVACAILALMSSVWLIAWVIAGGAAGERAARDAVDGPATDLTRPGH